MKYFLTAVGLCVLLAACGGGNTNPINPTTGEEVFDWQLPKANAPLGESLGDSSEDSRLIDSAGGRLSSKDNRVLLEVPAGAIAPNELVEFTLLPVDSSAPNGLGTTYRVSIPAAEQAFVLAPFSLEFVLDDSSNGLADTDLFGMTHNSNGDWTSTPATLQTTNARAVPNPSRRVRITSSKAGDFAISGKYKLLPPRASIQVNASLPMTVIELEPSSGTGTVGIKPLAVNGWSVNNVANGNSSLGILIASDRPNHKTFKAPATVPNPSTVRVSATVNAGGRNLVLTSPIEIRGSKGWMDFFTDGSYSKSYANASGSLDLKIQVNAQYSLDAFKFSGQAPTTIGGTAYPGSFTSSLALRPGSNGTASLEYTLIVREACTCGGGNIVRRVDYSFTAASELDQAIGGSQIAVGAIQSSGAYNLGLVNTAVILEGDYTYRFQEQQYPCGDRAALPEVNKAGKDRIVFGGSPKLKGMVMPQGPDSIKGTDNQTSPVNLPASSRISAPITATSVFSWYFPYRPGNVQGAPPQPQNINFSSPALQGAEEAAGIKPQPRC